MRRHPGTPGLTRSGSPRTWPLPAVLAIAFGLALAATVAPQAAAPVRAATPELTVTTDARYEVQPEQGRVHIRADAVATSRKRDTATRRYFFESTVLAVLPGTTGFRAMADGKRLTTRIVERTRDFTLVEVRFGRRLYFQQSFRFRLEFDLPDPGGTPTREVRVGSSLAAFPVWAFATNDTPGSSVTVVFPEGYTVAVEAGELPAPTTGDAGQVVFRTGRLADPLTFFAYLVGDRAGAFEETAVRTTVGDRPVDVLVRAWADDPAWGTRVARLFRDGLPALSNAIGLDYPTEDPLIVEEAVSRSIGGYAGLFDPRDDRVRVAYYADDFVVLHEAAHAWFNGSLVVDRWVSEAFSSYYAEQAAMALGIEARGDALTPELEAARLPLNAWAGVGREDATVEDYAYAATLQLAHLVAERATDVGLRTVWAAANEGAAAYQPINAAEPEFNGEPPDWRGLLDLLEERTGSTYADLWAEWVARPEDQPLLEARSAARRAYATTLAAAGDWELPRSVRRALVAWQFDTATRLLADADEVLVRRAEVEAAAERAGLVAPGTLRQLFEAGPGLEAALAEATAELATLEAIGAAAATRPSDPGLIGRIGLLDAGPEDDLAAAGEAFTRGDLEVAVDRAASARAAWLTAEEVGRGRLVAGAVVLVLLAVMGIVATALLIRRFADRASRRRAATTMAHPDPERQRDLPVG